MRVHWKKINCLRTGLVFILFCRMLIFQNQLFRKISGLFARFVRFTKRVSNSLDPDQDRHFVGPDLGPSCLQR